LDGAKSFSLNVLNDSSSKLKQNVHVTGGEIEVTNVTKEGENSQELFRDVEEC